MKEFILKILIAAVAILILYYVMSPYQNCLREDHQNKKYCTSHTSW